jgi:hypothetical protein
MDDSLINSIVKASADLNKIGPNTYIGELSEPFYGTETIINTAHTVAKFCVPILLSCLLVLTKCRKFMRNFSNPEHIVNNAPPSAVDAVDVRGMHTIVGWRQHFTS